MSNSRVGLSLILEDDYLSAALPLFEAGEVDVLEWSFDIGWGEPPPAWAESLIDFYGERGALLGHGVTFSPLSAQWQQRQSQWLQNFARECARRSYLHVSEHFGFSTAGSFHDSAPLPVPYTPESLAVGRDRLRRLAEVACVPIGLENLAFAFSARDVRNQGAFLEELLAPFDAFLLLDLHNVYCQTCNFGLAADAILDDYPLQRVRELHVSGGSWSESENGATIRRDTHDDCVPDEVFALVEEALRRCPNVQAVIFERLGGTLNAPHQAERFREDFRRLKNVVASAQGATS